MLVLVSLSCYLLVLLLFTLRRVQQPGELVPMHLNNTSSSTEESSKGHVIRRLAAIQHDVFHSSPSKSLTERDLFLMFLPKLCEQCKVYWI